MNKANLQELLMREYDKRRAILDLLDFYDIKLREYLDLKYIYTKWIKETKEKLEETDVSIQYLQEVLKEEKS